MGWKFRIWGFGEAIAFFVVFIRRLLSRVTPYSATMSMVCSKCMSIVALVFQPRSTLRRALSCSCFTSELVTRDTCAQRKSAALHASFSIGSSGARIHRADLPGWRRQMVDCMDAEPPFLALLGRATGNCKFFDQAASRFSDTRGFYRMKRPGFSFMGSKRPAEETGKSGLGAMGGLLWGL